MNNSKGQGKPRRIAQQPNSRSQAAESKKRKNHQLAIKIMAALLGLLIVLLAGVGIFYKSKLNLMPDPETIFQGEEDLDSDSLYEGQPGEPDPSAELIEEDMEKDLEAFLAEQGLSLEDIDQAFDEEASESNPGISEVKLDKISGVKNYLVLGIDSRANNFRGRSDAMMVVSLNTNKKKVNLLSLYRGTAVYIPGRGWDNLNHAYAYGGANLLKKTIELNFRLPIDGYVIFNFHAFRRLIDKVGGVSISITEKEAKVLDLAGAGRYHLGGSEALAYSRIRRIDSDTQRTARQRRVVNAVLNKMKNSSLSTINSVVDATLPNVSTNISHGEITSILANSGSYLSYGRSEMLAPSAQNRSRYYNKNGHEMWSFKAAPTINEIKNFLSN